MHLHDDRTGTDGPEPGDSTVLTMTAKVPESFQTGSLTCNVKTDHPSQPEWRYEIRYQSFPKARLVPERIDLGSIRLGKPLADGASAVDRGGGFWFESYSPDRDDLPEPGPVSSPAEIDAEPVGRAAVSRENGVWRLRQRFRARLLSQPETPGSVVGPFAVPIRGGGSASARVFWEVIGPLRISPSQVHFGLLDPGGGSVSRTIMVRSTEETPFRVLAARADSPAGSTGSLDVAMLPTEATTIHSLTLTFAPPDPPASGATAGSLRMSTDLPGMPDVRIPGPPSSGAPGPPGIDVLSPDLLPGERPMLPLHPVCDLGCVRPALPNDRGRGDRGLSSPRARPHPHAVVLPGEQLLVLPVTGGRR